MNSPVLLDTQLMVLLTVGETSMGIIGKHRNLSAYTEDDFDLLCMLLGDDRKLVLLPNIVSETANLLRQHKDPEKSRIMTRFKGLIEANEEYYVASRKVVIRPEYHKLGIADSAKILCCLGKYKILTADLDLYLAAQAAGVEAMNFNHSREDFALV